MIALALLMLSGVACETAFDPGSIVTPSSPGGTNASPASIVLVASSSSLTVGQSTAISATVKGTDGSSLSGVALEWTSDSPAVAAVSTSGVVTALEPGSATITGSSGSIKGQTKITVLQPSTAPGGFAPSPVALPRTQLDTRMPTAPSAGGAVIAVAAGADLQAAIDRANPGDVIELARGATYSGNFTLPNKGDATGWIVIRPASVGAALPSEGQRMTPQLAAAASLPRVWSPNGNPVFSTLPGAHHFRLVGLDVGVADGVTAINTLIALGAGDASQSTIASVPHDLVLDRMYIHGTSVSAVRRCVALNSAATAVIDSYVSECHDPNLDAQAVTGWNGPGPFKIVNNFLQASGEIVAFGGADPGIANLIPSDIEIRKNYITRPLSWKGHWLVKNLFEIKSANRVLLEANVLENNWLDGQDGTAILLKSVNQGGTAPWSNTSDVTVRFNVLRNVGAGFNLAAKPESYAAIPMSRIAITGNVISNIGTSDYAGTGRGILLLGDLADITITHNTITSATPITTLSLAPTGAAMSGIVYDNNLSAAAQDYGVLGQDAAAGASAWNTYVRSGSIRGNAFASLGNDGSSYPAGNFFPASQAAVGFTDLTNGNFVLSSVSPLKGQGTDGLDPGADVAAVLAAVQGVVTP